MEADDIVNLSKTIPAENLTPATAIAILEAFKKKLKLRAKKDPDRMKGYQFQESGRIKPYGTNTFVNLNKNLENRIKTLEKKME